VKSARRQTSLEAFPFTLTGTNTGGYQTRFYRAVLTLI
jgi:hypothetical protein